MSNPSIRQNRKITDPTLRDLLDLHKKDIMLSMNCHAIATVQSFDSSQQTITATINYKKSYLQMGTDGIYKTVLVDYPILLDVPIVILGGGPSQLTFPIEQGDQCLILFNDRDIDNWFQSGQVGPVASGRLHSFSDGIAIVGLRSLANSISGYDETRALLSHGETMVGVSATKVKIANQLYTLNGLLQDLLTQLEILTVVCAAPGNPSGPPVNAAAIAAIATQIGALLE
jgi:hypothetical protein